MSAEKRTSTYFKRDMFFTEPNFQLLAPHDILLWPARVVLPDVSRRISNYALDNLAVFDDPAQFLCDEWANPHCTVNAVTRPPRTFFAD